MSLRQRPIDKSNYGAKKDVHPDLIKIDSPDKIATSSGRVRVAIFAICAVVSAGLLIRQGGDVKGMPSSVYAVCTPGGQHIFTVDESNKNVECILIHDSRIAAIGSQEEITNVWADHLSPGANEDCEDDNVALDIRYTPRGSVVLPGLSDSHGHILEYGSSRLLNLDGAKSIDAVIKRIRDFVETHPAVLNNKSRLIEGWGWDHTSWPVEKFPSFEDLEADPMLRGRPIILQSKDGHALWVSHITLQTTLPLPSEVDGGVIILDNKGNPTGIFMDNAQELIPKNPPTYDDLMLRFNHTVKDALSLGLTSLHDAGFSPASLKFFQRVAKDNQLPIRIYAMTYFNETAEYNGNTFPKIFGANNGRLTSRSVKIFADGALRSGGAALYHVYHDNPETSGFMRIDPELLASVIPKYLRDGWQVNVHAIGDRANAIVLDAFEAALKGADVSALRPRLEHAQIMTKADMERLGRLGVIASVQPTHAISDMWYAQDRLGPERVKGLYAFRDLIDNGVKLALGSDFPVEDINPMSGFYAAVTRLSPEGQSPHGPEGWFPEQRLTREEALRGMTINPAYASFSEKDLGSLEVGKIADYVVLSQDIMAVPADKLLDTKVLATAIDGEVVYGDI